MPSLVSYRMCKDGESDLTSSPRIIPLTESLRNLSIGKKFGKCSYCDVLFTVNDYEVVRKGGKFVKWYHINCAKLVNMI